EFRAAATDAQRAVFVDTLVGPEVQRARELQAAAVAGGAAKHLEHDPGEGGPVNSTEIDLLRRVEDRLGVAGVLLVLALAVGLSLVVVRSLLGPLSLLPSSAAVVPHSQLP